MTGPERLNRLETMVVQMLDAMERGDREGAEVLEARLRSLLHLPAKPAE